MLRKNLRLSGYISKPHGTEGGITIRLTGDFSRAFKIKEPLFLEINETMVPFFIEELQKYEDRVIVKLEFIRTREEAEKYGGCGVYLDLKKKSELKDEEIISSFIGYEITDEVSGMSCVITGMTDTPMNPLFLAKYGKKIIYIPAQPDLIVSIDHKKKCIVMNLPEGFTEIN